MSQRYVRFDLDELVRLATKAIDSKYCISIEKYPNRMYNKVFLLTMNNDAQIVVKILNSNVERPHLTIASEVATMKFVCLVELFC